MTSRLTRGLNPLCIHLPKQPISATLRQMPSPPRARFHATREGRSGNTPKGTACGLASRVVAPGVGEAELLKAKSAPGYKPTLADIEQAQRLLEGKEGWNANQRSRIADLSIDVGAMKAEPPCSRSAKALARIFQDQVALLNEDRDGAAARPGGGTSARAATATAAVLESIHVDGGPLSISGVEDGMEDDLEEFFRGLSVMDMKYRFPQCRDRTELPMTVLFSARRNCSDPRSVFVARDPSGRIVALVDYEHLIANSPHGGKDCELNLLVADGLKRKGVGAHLVDFAMRHAARSGFQRMHAFVEDDNEGMHRLLRHRFNGKPRPAGEGKQGYVFELAAGHPPSGAALGAPLAVLEAGRERLSVHTMPPDIRLFETFFASLLPESARHRFALGTHGPELARMYARCVRDGNGGRKFSAFAVMDGTRMVGLVDYQDETAAFADAFRRALPDASVTLRGNACELSIVLQEQVQRKGLGKELLKFACAHAKAAGFSTMFAVVHDGNDAMCGLLDKAGANFLPLEDGQRLYLLKP